MRMNLIYLNMMEEILLFRWKIKLLLLFQTIIVNLHPAWGKYSFKSCLFLNSVIFSLFMIKLMTCFLFIFVCIISVTLKSFLVSLRITLFYCLSLPLYLFLLFNFPSLSLSLSFLLSLSISLCLSISLSLCLSLPFLCYSISSYLSALPLCESLHLWLRFFITHHSRSLSVESFGSLAREIERENAEYDTQCNTAGVINQISYDMESTKSQEDNDLHFIRPSNGADNIVSVLYAGRTKKGFGTYATYFSLRVYVSFLFPLLIFFFQVDFYLIIFVIIIIVWMMSW